MSSRALICLFVIAWSVSPTATGQCTAPSQSNLVNGVGALGNPIVVGETQRPGAAWTFRRTGETGPLLSGLIFGQNGIGYWGTPGAPFTIPIVGPLYSVTPAQNQVPFFDRPPSIEGVFFHPGNDSATDVVAVFSPQSTIEITRIDVFAEVLGDASNGVLLSMDARIGGALQSIITPTLIPFTASGSQTIAPPISAITMNPGDALWLRGDMNGSPTEDWCNANVRIIFRGGPIIHGPPRDSGNCVTRNLQLICAAAGSGPLDFVWRRNGTPLVESLDYIGVNTQILSIAALRPIEDGAQFDCIVATSCHSITSPAATVDVTGSGDMNCDTVISVGDIGGFVLALSDPVGYVSAFPGCEATNADLNCDGVVTVGDIGLFVQQLTNR